MAKNYNITDRSVLADDKTFYLLVDGQAGATSTTITRTHLGVPDAPASLTNPDGSEISSSAFKDGDTILIRYNAGSFRYELQALRAATANSTRVVSNGFSEAGYVADDVTEGTDNSEDFEIPSGARVGFGENGSSGNLKVKDGIVTGQGTSPLRFYQVPKAEPYEGGPTVVGDTLNDTNHGGFFGYGSELQPYAKFGEGSDTVPEYASESGVTGSLVVFDGVYTILGGSSQSEYDIGDIKLIDLIDDDLTSLEGRFRAELIANPVGGNWNWRVEGNLTDLIISTNYTAGVLSSTHSNSFSIGNNAYITADDQIVLGTTGGTGEIITSYDITTTGSITAGSGTLDIDHITLSANDASITIDPDGAAAYNSIVLLDSAGIALQGGNIELGGYIQNPDVADVPLRVKGITSTTADLFQVWDDAVKPVYINSSGLTHVTGLNVLAGDEDASTANNGDSTGLRIGETASTSTVSLFLGVDATNNQTWIQSTEPSVANRVLQLNPNGGDVEIARSTNTTSILGDLAVGGETTIINNNIAQVPLKVTSKTGTTADLFQVYDDATKTFFIEEDGTVISAGGFELNDGTSTSPSLQLHNGANSTHIDFAVNGTDFDISAVNTGGAPSFTTPFSMVVASGLSSFNNGLTVGNNTNSVTPLVVTGKSGTTADLFQVYDNISKVLHVNADGSTQVTTLTANNMSIDDSSAGVSFLVDKNSGSGDVFQAQKLGVNKLHVDNTGKTWVSGGLEVGGFAKISDGGATLTLDMDGGSGTALLVTDGGDIATQDGEINSGGDLLAAGQVNFSGLPTSSGGLSAGDLWNDSGSLKIV